MEKFESWEDLLMHVAAGLSIWYHAPLDVNPVRVRAEIRSRMKVRVFPPSRDCDPFTADRGHLDRFRGRLSPGEHARRNASGQATPLIAEAPDDSGAFITLAGPQRFKHGWRWCVRLGVKDGCAYGGCCMYLTQGEARQSFERYSRKMVG